MRPKFKVGISLVLACLCALSASVSAQNVALDGLTLQPGDHVRVTVLGEDKDMSGEFEVAPDSSLKHPLYNQVKVAGVPLTVLKGQFVTFLQKFQKDPQLEIEPLFKVDIVGEVRNPSIYFLSPETTVGEALTRANGATERADVDRVLLVRNGKTLSLNLDPQSSNRDVRTVQSGDQINVVARKNVVSGLSSVAPLLSVTVSLISLTVFALTRGR